MAIVLLVLFVLMWIVLIVPRQRELRRHNALVASLEVGDEVMTTSGIYGVLRQIDGDHVQLEVAPSLQLKVAKRAVASKVPPPVAAEGPLADGAPATVTETVPGPGEEPSER